MSFFLNSPPGLSFLFLNSKHLFPPLCSALAFLSSLVFPHSFCLRFVLFFFFLVHLLPSPNLSIPSYLFLFVAFLKGLVQLPAVISAYCGAVITAWRWQQHKHNFTPGSSCCAEASCNTHGSFSDPHHIFLKLILLCVKNCSFGLPWISQQSVLMKLLSILTLYTNLAIYCIYKERFQGDMHRILLFSH